MQRQQPAASAVATKHTLEQATQTGIPAGGGAARRTSFRASQNFKMDLVHAG